MVRASVWYCSVKSLAPVVLILCHGGRSEDVPSFRRQLFRYLRREGLAAIVGGPRCSAIPHRLMQTTSKKQMRPVD